MASKPQRDNVPAGTYAIRIGENQQIWRLRESDDPFMDDLEWEKVGERSIESVPRSDYEGGRWEAEDGDIIFYVEDIDPEKEPESPKKQTKLTQDAPYVLQVESADGTTKTISGSRQSDVFADTIEHLIDNYQLADELKKEGDLPYVPGYKNAFVNDEPRHPNGDEMTRVKSICGGDFYVSTSPTKGQKVDTLDYFADLVNVDIHYKKGWDS